MTSIKIETRENPQWGTEYPDGIRAYHDVEIQEDGLSVGYASCMEYPDDSVRVDSLFIDEDHRNGGIGTKALHLMHEELGTLTLAADNEDAARLYRRLGCDTRTPDMDGLDCGYGVYDI